MEQSTQTRATRTALSLLVVAAVAGCAAESGMQANPIVIPNGQAGQGAGGTGVLPMHNATAGIGSQPMNQPMAGATGTDPDGNNPRPGAGTAIPCEVEKVVKSGCQTCHGASQIGGAPMPLMTLADFQADYAVKTTPQMRGQTMKMHQLAKIRVNAEMGTRIMPDGVPLAAADKTMLSNWLAGGAVGGTACAAPMNQGGTGAPPVGGTGGTTNPTGRGSECEAEDTFAPLVAQDGEMCWEFPVHGQSGATDTSKFSVPLDESYSQFYYNVPWPADHVATRFGSRFDNLKVLHHWLAFKSSSGSPHGTVTRNVTGTTFGENAELIAGWAVGGCTTTYPADVGVKLPATGKIMVQWHHYNHTGAPAADGSAVQICTVPQSMRPNIAGLTFLGTEDFNGLLGMGPGKQDFTTSCPNDSNAPIHIIGFTPHMHTIGSNMKTDLKRAAGGMQTTIFDKPFKFDEQVNYMLKPEVVMMPGDELITTCTFQNDTGFNVAFGQSTNQEMCYQFALAYPYGALNNGVGSLIAATNTCW